MNQILSLKNSENIPNQETLLHKKRTFNFFKFEFIFCSIFALVSAAYYGYLQYDKKQKEALSKQILDHVSITSLYDNMDSNYDSLRLSTQNTYQTGSLGFSVIGIIEIKAIGIHYPIINEFNYELLKIAPCKFFGPLPNQIR